MNFEEEAVSSLEREATQPSLGERVVQREAKQEGNRDGRPLGKDEPAPLTLLAEHPVLHSGQPNGPRKPPEEGMMVVAPLHCMPPVL